MFIPQSGTIGDVCGYFRASRELPSSCRLDISHYLTKRSKSVRLRFGVIWTLYYMFCVEYYHNIYIYNAMHNCTCLSSFTTNHKQQKVKQRLFYRDGLCWSLVWYVNSWSVMESALCHEMFTWSSKCYALEE